MNHIIGRTFFCASLVYGFVAPLDEAIAWGRLGHETVAREGARLATSSTDFWVLNAENMGRLSLVPDAEWKDGPNAQFEKPTHWFEFDGYFNNPADFAGFPHSFA